MKFSIKKYIKKIYNLIYYRLPKNRFNWIRGSSNAIILMGDPEYENLGDHAIGYATRIFIENNLSKYEYMSIPENYILNDINRIKKSIKSTDILLLQGGGNLGDLYIDQIKIRKKVIKHFPLNRIVLMPQTIFYKKDPGILPEYFLNHQDLILIAREKISYKIMKSHSTNQVYLMPDIVFYLYKNIELENFIREGALICIRNDIESNGNTTVKIEKVKEALQNKGVKYTEISTLLKTPISTVERERSLEILFNKFKSSELIITDRLHGMIIAAITKTPCIVLPTFNHKVVSCYEWIKDLNYVQLCNKFNEIEMYIDNIMGIKDSDKTDIIMEKEFDKLVQIIKEGLD